AILTAELYASLTELWMACGVGNPARGDSFEAVKHSLENGGVILLAFEDGAAAGTVWLTHDFRRLYIHHMGVMPGQQNRGIGKALLDEALQVCRELGYQAKLEVHRDNPAAIRLYQSSGFEALDGYITMINRSIIIRPAELKR
ncbi:MAG: GNAT family N-acetyltransferase, partial [Candidatus Cloacimonadaceae bacterium]|nr:GNAT family N-acetyltransferase [Candidatus Cloacimonadaceae bacterium]